jgi:hypothetical protein
MELVVAVVALVVALVALGVAIATSMSLRSRLAALPTGGPSTAEAGGPGMGGATEATRPPAVGTARAVEAAPAAGTAPAVGASPAPAAEATAPAPHEHQALMAELADLRRDLEQTQLEVHELKAATEVLPAPPPPPPLPRGRSGGLQDLREQLRAAHRESAESSDATDEPPERPLA